MTLAGIQSHDQHCKGAWELWVRCGPRQREQWREQLVRLCPGAVVRAREGVAEGGTSCYYHRQEANTPSPSMLPSSCKAEPQPEPHGGSLSSGFSAWNPLSCFAEKADGASETCRRCPDVSVAGTWNGLAYVNPQVLSSLFQQLRVCFIALRIT